MAAFSFEHYPPLSLYVHLPWCVKKCPYCDFNSHGIGLDSFPEDKYVESLIKDLEFSLPVLEDRPITSIFIGGGTPSLFSAESLERLLSALAARMSLVADVEITLEANPGTVDAARFQAFREIGINRLSIGVQSFNNLMLQRLGRIHDAETAHAAIEAAKAAGFQRINLDIMYCLPGQDAAGAMADIRQAIAHGPVHLSRYQLTIEPNTLFYKDRPVLPDEEVLWEMQESGRKLLADCDYAHYEISASAKPGFECRHNLNYWQYGDYLGIGAGAHSKLTDLSANRIYRFVRHRMPDRYMQLVGDKAAISETKTPDQQEIILEFMMNALRLNKGFTPDLFTARTGLPLQVIDTTLGHARTKGWIECDSHTVRASAKGRNFLNDLLQCFMPVADS